MAKTKVHGEFLKDSVVRFTAKAGENITKGQAVYISGISGEVSVVSLADANDTAKMPAFGLAEATVSTNAEVEITSFGTLKGLDTSSYSLGDILYVDTTAGALTNNPSGLEATKLQNIGMVQRVHATSGSIKVGGAGRTNAVPNLDDGDIFIGDSNNKAISDSFTNVLNSEAGINSSADATAITIDSSENVGIGTSSPNQLLEVAKSSGGATINISTDQAPGSISSKLYTNLDFSGYNNNVMARLQSWDESSSTGYGYLTFHTNNGTSLIERMRINSSGNVGIGASTALDNKLEVNGGDIRVRGTSTPSIKFNNADQEVVALRLKSGATGVLSFHTDKMVIDSSGNVGIGVVPESWNSAFRALDIGVNGALISQTAGGGDELHLISNGYYDGAWKYKESNSANQIVLNNGAITFEQAASGTANASLTWTESMRIDSSGNLLVGTTQSNPTSSGVNVAGQEFSTTGGVRSTVASNPAATFNRKTDDGDIVLFRKDGSTVGTIVVNSSTIQMGTNNTHLAFSDADDAFFVKNAAGANRDGSHDLGKSNARFKDLYLSGGAYLGGTGSANKLDDYEEGTYTPTFSVQSGTPSYNYQQAYYTKIGRQVYGGGIIGVTNANTLGGAIKFSLPFTVDCGNLGVAGAWFSDGSGFNFPLTTDSGDEVYTLYGQAPDGSTSIQMIAVETSSGSIRYSDVGTTMYFRFGFSYPTS